MTTSILDPDQLVAQACEATGLNDFGEDGWQEGLDRLVAAEREEAALSELGEQIAAGELVMYLSNRLGITDVHRRHPEIGAADVTPPIVIVGQGRTGTTILHDLLAQDPAHRVPLTWEVDRPCPPPEAVTYLSDPRIDEVDALLGATDQLLPGFRALHPMGARLAQECVRITGCDFRSLIFATQYRVPSYVQWLLEEADMAPAYRWHRRFLQALQWHNPGERWVLKSPAHQWCLGTLLGEYPNALLVQTHRDPLQVISSLGSLVASLRGLASDDTSMAQASAEFANYVLDGLDRSVAAREDGSVPAGRIVDVQFRDFMADPFVTIGQLYEHLGLNLTDAAEQRMRAFLADNPRTRHGEHRYSFADTGLDAEEMRARSRRYQEFFDVASEPVR
ncbi:MAG TPA: sulfotransferase [Acidimicrobiales bacterium]|nr:sulfotransferase [Acidimicrobiales bacterium]